MTDGDQSGGGLKERILHGPTLGWFNDPLGSSVGQYVSSEVLLGSAVSLTSGVYADITSISLTAGDWDVSGTIIISPSVGTTWAAGWISSTSATFPVGTPNGGAVVLVLTGTGNQGFESPTGTRRYSLTSITTIYLSGAAQFASGTCSAYGGIYARRIG